MPDTPAEASQPGLKGPVLAALSFATATVFADLYITQPILPVLSREFGVSPASAGLTLSAVVSMIALVSAGYGFLSDLVGRKPVMVASCAMLVVPTLLCAAAPSFRTLVLCRALQGLLMPGVTAVAVAYLGDYYAGADLGPKVGGWIAASVAGGLTGRVMSGLIASWIHWRAPFVVFGLLTLAGALVMGRALPPRRTTARVPFAQAYRGMFGHFRNRRVVGAYVIGGTVFFSFIGMFTYLPYYLTAPPFLLSTAVVSSAYLVYLAGVLASLISGRLASRVGARAVMAAGMAIACCGALGTLGQFLPTIVLSLIVLCIGMFTVQSTAPAFVNANAAGVKGGAGALYTSFYYVGASFGSVLPGYAWQLWGWKGVVTVCLTGLSIGLLSDLLLCR